MAKFLIDRTQFHSREEMVRAQRQRLAARGTPLIDWTDAEVEKLAHSNGLTFEEKIAA